MNVEKEQFVLVVNDIKIETNLRQLTKQIHRKARSLEVEKEAHRIKKQHMVRHGKKLNLGRKASSYSKKSSTSITKWKD